MTPKELAEKIIVYFIRIDDPERRKYLAYVESLLEAEFTRLEKLHASALEEAKEEASEQRVYCRICRSCGCPECCEFTCRTEWDKEALAERQADIAEAYENAARICERSVIHHEEINVVLEGGQGPKEVWDECTKDPYELASMIRAKAGEMK